VHVITRAVYRSNDSGYLDAKRHTHIWLLVVPAACDEIPKPVQLTSGNFDEHEPVWSHDGSRIYFTTRQTAEPYYELPSTDIYSVAAAGGKSEKLATLPMSIGDLVLSPEGDRLAFHGAAFMEGPTFRFPTGRMAWLLLESNRKFCAIFRCQVQKSS
jgi:dipeptidyl aminopeptidase/acylaminoacyl peptidase